MKSAIYAGSLLEAMPISDSLGDVPLDAPEVSRYIREYLEENKRETDGGVLI